MESMDVDNTIAKLVLGYLWKKKCRSAYKELFRTSRCFKNENSDSDSIPKYFPTRFRGLTLNDILREYIQICQIVQDKLEVTNFYDEDHTKSSLVYQLLYLLNKVQRSRASTPCPSLRSPPDSNIGETSPYRHTDNVSDVEATPAHSLPGNIKCRSEESYLDKNQKNPKRKTHLKASNRSNEGHSSSPVSDQGEDMAEVMVDTEMLAQTLLENKEFHEKIAHTINKVAAKQFKESSELNETIKTVVRETEEDPIFDRILDEIIGSTNILENGKGIETSSNASSIDVKTKKTPKKLNLSQSHQSTKLDSESQTVEEQNEEAIRSIIAKSKTVPEAQLSSLKEQGNEIIMFDGSLDKYLITNTSSVQPFLVNTMGHVLTNFNGNLQVQQVTPCYRMTKPTTNWSVPAKVITEQDILTMPTVIVTDDRQNSMVPSVLNTPLLQPAQTQTIVPSSTNKATEVAASREECLTLYSAPKSSKPGLKRVIYPKPTIYIPSDVNIQNNAEPPKTTNLPSTTTLPKAIPEASETSSNITESKVASTSALPLVECYVKNDKCVERKEATIETVHVVGTPPPLANNKKPTPKSGSHVRNLDFSSPQKITSTRKTCTKASNANKTKSASKKQTSKILFDPSVDVIELDADKTWDTDLRASVPLDKCDSQTPKRLKRKMSVKSSKRKIKKSENVQLNTTADDAKLLEQALQTPIKSKDDDDSITKQEFAETKETKSKQEENKNVAGDNQIKTIISPSKLNASKRNLNTSSNPTAEDESKFITPDMTRENVTYGIKANRNIISLLKTPVKDRQFPPKTPGVDTPIDFNVSAISNSTPFTKMLQANLKSIDLTSLPTPNIPITPSFPPFTPTIDLISPYSNRPTDYSTPSSYYQPSDNEQNKSLEAHLLEVEKKPVEKEIIQQAAITNEYLNTFNKNIIGKKNLSLMKRTMSSNSSTSDDSSAESSNTDDSLFRSTSSNQTVVMGNKTEEVASKTYSLRSRNVLNKNSVVQKTRQGVIEKKTVSKPVRKPLVKNKKSASKLNKKATEKAAEGSVLPKATKQEETASKSDAASNDGENSHKNNLDISKLEVEHATKEPVRHKPTKQATVAECDNKRTTTIKMSGKHDAGNIDADPSRKTNLYASKLQTAVVTSTEKELLQKELLQKELDAKRLRVIDRLKKAEEIAIMKTKNRRFKLKPIPNVSHVRRKPRKSPSPRKRILKQPSVPTGKALSILIKDLNDSDDDPDLLHDETIRATNQIIIETEKFAKSTSDVEAQTLIEGLKERGIHLIHNKLSKQTDNDVAVVTTDETKDNDVADINEETRDNVTIVTEEVTDNLDNSATTLKKNASEMNGSNLNSDLPVFSKRSFDDDSNFHINFDESQKQSKSIDNYNINILSQKIVGKVFIEELNREIDVLMNHVPFHSLIEIESTTQTVQGSLGTDKNYETDIIDSSVVNETDDSEKVDKINILQSLIIKAAVSSEEKPVMNAETDATASVNFTQPDEEMAEPTRDSVDPEHISVFKEGTNESAEVCIDKTNDSLKGALESVTDSGENLPLKRVASKESTTNKRDAGVEQHMVEKRMPRKYEKIHACIKETTNADEVVIDDDLMTLALTRREEIPDGSQSPKSSRKRKLKSGEDSHTEKKCKNILKRLDVDSFLNNIHGGSNYYGKN